MYIEMTGDCNASGSCVFLWRWVRSAIIYLHSLYIWAVVGMPHASKRSLWAIAKRQGFLVSLSFVYGVCVAYLRAETEVIANAICTLANWYFLHLFCTLFTYKIINKFGVSTFLCAMETNHYEQVVEPSSPHGARRTSTLRDLLCDKIKCVGKHKVKTKQIAWFGPVWCEKLQLSMYQQQQWRQQLNFRGYSAVTSVLHSSQQTLVTSKAFQHIRLVRLYRFADWKMKKLAIRNKKSMADCSTQTTQTHSARARVSHIMKLKLCSRTTYSYVGKNAQVCWRLWRRR